MELFIGRAFAAQGEKIGAAPCVHPAKARRIAANIAKLPELFRKTRGG